MTDTASTDRATWTSGRAPGFGVLLQARIRMLRNAARAMTPAHRGIIGSLVIAGMILFSLIGIGCAVFIRILESATAIGPGLSPPAAALVGRVYQYLFFFLLAGSVPFVASSLFQDADLPLLLTTPISPAAVVGMKMVDATVSNSAQFVVLGVPVLVGVAWGVHLSGAGWMLFLIGVLLLMAITPAITAFVLLVIARIVGIRRIRFVVMAVSIALALAITLLAVAGASRASQNSTMTAGKFKQALSGDLPPEQAFKDIRTESRKQQDASAPQWLPSTWASQCVLETAFGGHSTPEGYKSFGLLAVTWLALLCLCIVAGRSVVTSEELLEQRDLDQVARGGKGRGGIPFPGMSSAATGVTVKDLRYIGRDTIMVGQIGTTLILFLVPFVLKLTDSTPAHADFDMYGNLSMLMVALVAYMVTSIIGLSSVGLEGKGAWMLFASPIRRMSLLGAKWIVSFVLSLIIVVAAAIVDALAFRWAPQIFGIALAILVCMSFALSGLGVGLSGIFPRFLYDNPAHRASIWAMVLGFVFSTLYVGLAGSVAVVGYLLVLHAYNPTSVIAGGIGLFLLLTVLFGIVPVWIAERRLASYQWEL